MNNQNSNGPEYNRLLHEQRERLKELACINRTTSIIKEEKSIEETLQQIVMLIPDAWQYPDFTVARIKFMNIVYTTSPFQETKWLLSQDFSTIDNELGTIEVFYTMEFKIEDEGP